MTVPKIDPMSQGGRRNLRTSVRNSSAWTIAGFGLSQVVRLASNVALAALLFPEAFGLMAIVATITGGFALLTDIGLGANIVQSKRGDVPAFLNTAWTVQAIRGTGLALLVAAMAWPVATFYASSDPLALELQGIIPVVALGILIDAFQSTNMRTAARHMSLGRVTVLQIGSQCTGIAVMIWIAWQTRSVYAMAVGGVVTAIVQSALSHVVLPGISNKFQWEKSALREIVHFGKWVVLSTIIFFFATQIDKLVFAKVFTLAELGAYSIAASLAAMPAVLLGKLQGSVIFPLFARMLDRGERLDAVMGRIKVPLLTIAAYLLALSIACAGSFVEVAYTKAYSSVAIFIPILAVGVWFGSIGGLYSSAILASGKPQRLAINNAVRLAIFCVLVVPSIYLGGLLAAVIAVGMIELVKLPLVIWFARQLGLRDFRAEMWLTAFSVVAGLGTYFGVRVLPFAINERPVVQLLVQFLLVTLLFAPLFAKTARAISGLKS
jgi:O-antigen/teichoic acid export membrane protein